LESTSATLLQKLRAPDERQAWERFVKLYSPLLLYWAGRMGLQPSDALDLVQDVLVKLLRELPKFQYDPSKKNFRGWLRTICFNHWRDRVRAKGGDQFAGEAGLSGVAQTDDGLEHFWNQEHDAFLVRQALRLFDNLSNEFEPQTLQACRLVVLERRSPEDVAKELQISVNTVYIAKLRVLRRLRQELSEFLT